MGYGQVPQKQIQKHVLTEAEKKAQEEAVIKWVSEQVAVDKQQLMAKFPFTGNVMSRLDVLVGHWDDVPTACTDGDKIWIDVLFYTKLDPEERLFVLAHECWHVILRHFLRKMNRNRELWNWATDLEIHFLLTKEGLKAPFVLPHNPSWKDLSFEEIYDRLLQQAKRGEALGSGKKPDDKDGENGVSTITISEDELGDGDSIDDFEKSPVGKIPKGWNKGKDSKNLKGSNEAKGWDSHDKKADAEQIDDPKELEDKISNKIRSSIEFAKKRYRGILPAHLSHIVDSLPKNEISWQQLLRQFVTQTMRGNNTWLPPNRRHVWRGMYMQSRRQEEFYGVVALDTSGSCVPELPKFFSELVGLLNTFGKYELTVIQCDAKIQNVETYSDEVLPPNNKKWRMYGGGGTSHVPVFEWIDKNMLDPPNCVICLTDLYTDFPEKVPHYPVLWISTAGEEAPFGTITKFGF